MSETEALLALARSGDADDRSRLVDAVADLFDDASAAPSEEARALLADIFLTLVRQAERDLRRRLAERLAAAPWAPLPLIQLLALDEIEIARPVIAQSPLLGDADLVRLLVEATLEHQIEVARRPRIGGVVVGVILDHDRPAVLAALAGNETAEISPLAMARLVTASRRVAAARAPLVRHPRLTAALAACLCGWVGDALKANLIGRFQLDPTFLSAMIDEAVGEQSAAARLTGVLEPGTGREDMERKLVLKLQAAGQLRPSYLLRVLREGRLVLFVHALSALGGREPAEAWATVRAPTAEPLAQACAAVGLDRSVFPTVLSLVRALNEGSPGGGEAAMPRRPPAGGQNRPAFI